MQKVQFLIVLVLILVYSGCQSGSSKDVNLSVTPLNNITELDSTTITVAEEFVAEESPIDYEEKVDIPLCDSNNTSIAFIRKSDDWNMINREDKTIFCVHPGDYSDIEQVVLRTSGTKESRRYIILDNGSNEHPGKLAESMLAKVSLLFEDTSFWVIDRMGYWERNDSFIPIVFRNSDHNILNRCLIRNVKGGGIVFYPNSDSNTLQNSRIERTDVYNYMDRAAIEFSNDGADNISIKNNKIIHNEIINYVDGIQFVKTDTAYQKYINYEGTVIDHNHIYIDSTLYTDCKGHFNTNGKCAYAENAIDLKGGSENSENPLIISYNSMWGYRESDGVDWTKYENESNLNDFGVVIPVHFNVKNVVFKKNVFFDAVFGLVFDGERYGYSAQNIQIEKNIFYNIYSSAIYGLDVSEMTIDGNLFKQISYGLDDKGTDTYSSLYFNQSDKITFSNNKVVNTYRYAKFYVKESDYNGADRDYFEFEKNTYFNAKVADDDNSYEQSIAVSDQTGLIVPATDGDPTSDYKELVITTDNYSDQIREFSLQNVVR